jgi:Ca2+-binding RTX toxin-like protein
MNTILEPLESRRHYSVSLQGSLLVVNGTLGDDRIRVGAGNGNIVVTVGSQRDSTPAGLVARIYVYASSGNDSIAIANDTFGCYVDAGPGNDSVIGGDGNDTLTGGAGKNTLVGQAGNDRINGSSGRDSIIGMEGADRLYGNGGNDTLDGGGSVDRLFGGDGDDVLTGGGSNDKLYGDAGNDLLFGKSGADLCDGGAGSDAAEQDGSDTLLRMEEIRNITAPLSLPGTYKGTWPSPANPTLPYLGQFQLSISSAGGTSITGIFKTMLGTEAVTLTGSVSGKNFTLGYTSPYSGIDYKISITGTLNGNSIGGFASVKSSTLLVDGNFTATRS